MEFNEIPEGNPKRNETLRLREISDQTYRRLKKIENHGIRLKR